MGERYFHSVKGLCVRERKSERVREAVLLQGISIYLRYGGNTCRKCKKDIASLGERYLHSVKGLCVRERKSERVRERLFCYKEFQFI